MPNDDLSAFIDFIEKELDLDGERESLPFVIFDDWPDREERIAEARMQLAAAYKPPRVQVIDKTTFLICWIGMLFIALLMLMSRFA